MKSSSQLTEKFTAAIAINAVWLGIWGYMHLINWLHGLLFESGTL